METTNKVRLGSLLLGAGAGGFVTATILNQILQWRALAGTGTDDRTAPDVWTIGVVGGLVRLGLWVAVVIGIGLLWSASSRGGRRLRGRAIGGWALVGWGALAVVLGVVGLAVDTDASAVIDIALVVLGLATAAVGWWTQRGLPLEPGPLEQRPRRRSTR